jgi:hypothetical protein
MQQGGFRRADRPGARKEVQSVCAARVHAAFVELGYSTPAPTCRATSSTLSARIDWMR